MNLYVYGLNNPLRYMDRSGNTPEELEGLSDQSGGACIREKSGADKVTETLGHGCQYLYQKAKNHVTGPWGNPRTYQSAECEIQLSLETIQAMAGIPEGEQILKNTIPEESYIYQTSSYQDGVSQKTYDKSFAQTVEEQYGNLKGLVMQEIDLYFEGMRAGWEDYHREKDTDKLWAFLLGDWEGRREADAALREGVETAVEDVLDSKEVHGIMETVEEYTEGYTNIWEMIGAVRYMNAGYSPEEAVILAEENMTRNEKYLLSGMAMGLYDSVPGLYLSLTNAGPWMEAAVEGTVEGIRNLTVEKVAEAAWNLSHIGQMDTQYLAEKIAEIGSERLDTYFYSGDEEAYKAMGTDLEMVIEVALSVAAAGAASGGKAVQKEVMEETAERAVKEISSFADLMTPEDAARYLDFLENGSKTGLTVEELASIEKVDELLALKKVSYQDVLDMRNADVAIESGSKLKIEEVVPPGSTHPVKVYTDGNAQINTGKIDTYIRGKVELDVEATTTRIDELKDLRKSNPENFTKEMKKELQECEDRLHNYQRSQEMSNTLNTAGIEDTIENNQMIVENLFDAAKEVTEGNTEIISYIEGVNGKVQVVSRWKILPDGTPYLATVILKPVK